MTKRVAIFGAGPSGLAQLRAFQSKQKVPISLRSFALKNKLTGAACGTTHGAPD
jgi:hypothetical protein